MRSIARPVQAADREQDRACDPVRPANQIARAEVQHRERARRCEPAALREQPAYDVEGQPATKVVPGTEVIYTITVSNLGDEPADSVVVTDPIPENTTYVDRSAFGAGTKITFSVDGGKSYDLAGKLKVKDAAGNLRAATASDYTHIRWVLNFTLKPKDVAPVWFKARLN